MNTVLLVPFFDSILDLKGSCELKSKMRARELLIRDVV